MLFLIVYLQTNSFIRYAPINIDELVGAATLVRNLIKWLSDWDAVHLKKRIKVLHERSNPGARAALLSGPPGIGKTTTARLVARHCDREVFELNASDTRSKKLIAEGLRDVVGSGLVGFSSSKKGSKGRVIIMDEVDGMSSSDRGGMQELAESLVNNDRISMLSKMCLLVYYLLSQDTLDASMIFGISLSGL